MPDDLKALRQELAAQLERNRELLVKMRKRFPDDHVMCQMLVGDIKRGEAAKTTDKIKHALSYLRSN